MNIDFYKEASKRFERLRCRVQPLTFAQVKEDLLNASVQLGRRVEVLSTHGLRVPTENMTDGTRVSLCGKRVTEDGRPGVMGGNHLLLGFLHGHVSVRLEVGLVPCTGQRKPSA